MKRMLLATICSLAIAASSSAAAHDEFRIIGTVTKITATTLDVKQTKDNQIVSMQMDKESLVTRDKKKVDRAELKTGASVVVDALGDTIKNLLVLEVRLVPAPAKKK